MRGTWWLWTLVLVLLLPPAAHALEWLYLVPNPAYSRDLAMGASTAAQSYAMQSQSVNPAGLSLYSPRTPMAASMVLNPGGIYQLRSYAKHEAEGRSDMQQVADAARLCVTGVAVQTYIITAAATFEQPVMNPEDLDRYRDYDERTPLDYSQSSLAVALALHPRVAVGGRVDRYFRQDRPDGDAYSYGVILRPKNISLAVQYQHFPATGARLWHPLDRRADAATSAALAIERSHFSLTAQVMNLTMKDATAFLEPHAGLEWRPGSLIALRAGAMTYSKSDRWAWTGGIGLLDANMLHSRLARLVVPDDVLQLAVGVVYEKRTPVTGIGSLTCAWRF